MNEVLKSGSFPKGLPHLRSEFEARGLTALKAAAVAAHEAYHGHKFTGDASDLEAVIAFDLEDKRLLRACSNTETAYQSALDKMVDGGAL